jgi:hypothetical protein
MWRVVPLRVAIWPTSSKKQAPIVFWDFEIDEKKKIDFLKDECG